MQKEHSETKRLAAIFIPANSLPNIFGREHSSQTINLGGKYHYKLKEVNN